uniref:uncharacterized protein LOC131104668 n=1 Tax=Doryrhamphus excisus TaxID=161450 RepID=UPI0025ADE9D7|nr:uncharacterized protein LOC131104668 [Doryrhamphus excisus]
MGSWSTGLKGSTRPESSPGTSFWGFCTPDIMLGKSCVVWILLFGISAAAVFVERQEANTLLSRWRRANSGFLEELKQGNLERECREEICDYEEAREVFEDDGQTKQFWQTYDRQDPCKVNPCQNNGMCVHMGTTFECQCPEGYEGRFCQMVFEDSLKCIYHNGQCEHFCDGSGRQRKCSCADGYILAEDGRHCVAQVEFPCGQLAPANQSMTGQTRLVGANQCPKGECPWQVLIELNGASHCGGALIRPDWVITAAHCVHGTGLDKLTVVAGEQNLDADDGTEQRITVSKAIAHEGYVPATGDGDIALLHLSRGVALNSQVLPICLPNKDLVDRELLPLRYHSVSGWGKRTSGGNAVSGGLGSPVLRKMSVPLIPNSQCSQVSQFNFTANMLCAGYMEGQQESCTGDDGSPLTSLFGSTHFLLGVVGWGRGCTRSGYYGVYTNMAKFVDWTESTMKNPPTSDLMLQQKVVEVSKPSRDAMLPFHGLLLTVLLMRTATAHVFLGAQEARQVLMRQRRANSFLEEVKQGNMERECMEERCSWEEAREIFEDEDKTAKFWATYVDGDACASTPCANGGRCKDGIGSYECFCAEGFQGSNCEIAALQLCENNNGGCDHFCKVVRGQTECWCADGYFPSDKSCYSNERFKCGVTIQGKTRSILRDRHRNTTEGEFTTGLYPADVEGNITSTAFSSPGNLSSDAILNEEEEEEVFAETAAMTRIVNGKECPADECPWQALLLDDDGKGFCGGTILNQYIILTAAHCITKHSYVAVRLGESNTEDIDGNEVTHNVEAIFKHNNYRPDTFHNDIALLKLATPIKFTRYMLPACLPESDFAEKVLMKQPHGMVSGFGRTGEDEDASTTMQRLSVPYVARHICQESTDFHISTRMFCAGYDTEAKDACRGDSGGPHVTKYKSTTFITGIVSWGEGCARKGKYGIYTQVSKFVGWIREGMQRLLQKEISEGTVDGALFARRPHL